MLKSPSIQIFEKATTSPATPVTGVGMATVGFSTMGPLNKLMRFESYTQFERMMGKPVAEYPFAHLMASKVLNGGSGSVYFIRAGESTAEKATVYVANHNEIHPVRAFYASAVEDADNAEVYDRIVQPYFVASGIGDLEADASVKATIEINITPSTGESFISITKEFTFNKITLNVVGGETKEVFAVHVDTVVNRFNADSTFLQHAKLYNKLNGVNGLFIVGKSYEEGAAISIDVTGGTVEAERVAESDEDFDGLLNDNPSGLEAGTSTFTIESKYPGSGYNGYYVKKYDYDNPLTSTSDTFILEVYSKENVLLETFTELTLDTFIGKINDENTGSDFIYIDGTSVAEFVDGTYVLGSGELLPDGTYGFENEDGFKVIEGTDGVPSTDYGDELVSSMFINALAEPSLLNLDNVFFSIISVPDSQSSLVQDAAVYVARTRGDAVCVLDVPFDYSIDKTTVDSAVSWHNGGAGLRSAAIESSYAVIYYGWTSVANPYGTGNLMVPPSVQMVPLMLAVDSTDGSYYAPAGATRGRVIASDYVYSPDQEDREKMSGGVNCINPIIYSNARGLMAYGQKTAERTSSPLNRINIRRMVNEIKRLIYSGLDVVRFELNNATTQDRARKIVSDIFFTYKSAGAIEMYTVNVSSPGGSERDVLNVYVDFVPVGLVERIRVYLNITESGVTVGEEA